MPEPGALLLVYVSSLKAAESTVGSGPFVFLLLPVGLARPQATLSSIQLP